MYFANPWGLLALASLPAIVAIHYLRRRFRPVRVAGLFLWIDDIQQRPTGRRWDELPISASLLLELLAALALSLLLAGPRLGGERSVEHLVIVVDNTASMSAVAPGQESVARQAVDRILEEADRLGPGARVTVLATGTPPMPLVGPAAPAHPRAEVEEALKAWSPTLGAHSFDPALALGRQLAGANAQVLFLTDHLPDDASKAIGGVSYVALGTSLANVGFISARRDLDPATGDSRCFVVLRNYGGAPVDTTLNGVTISGSGSPQQVVSQPVRISANSQWRSTIRLSADMPAIRLTIDDDALAVDNAAILAPESLKVVRYRVLVSGAVADAVGKAMGAIRGTVKVGSTEPADLVFASAALPPDAEPGVWQFLLGPLPLADPNDYLATPGPFIIERGSDATIVRDVTLAGAIVGRIAPTPPNLAPLISAGDRIVLGRRTDTDVPTWVLNADLSPTHSSVVRWTVDWVILVSNLVVQRRRAMPGLDDRNFRLGESIVIPLAAEQPAGEPQPLTLQAPTGPPVTLAAPTPGTPLILDDLPLPGLYMLTRGGVTLETFAVNLLDERESNLTVAGSGRLGDDQMTVAQMMFSESTLNTQSWLLALLVAVAVAALLGNWYLLARRGSS